VPRIAFLVEYNGKRFHGSQWQEGVRTVQSELEAALKALARQELRVTLSGRTDTGVHSTGQVGHVDWPHEIPARGQSGTGGSNESGKMDLWRIAWGLNGILKQDIAIAKMQIVDETFHARFCATEREYVYRILNRPMRSAQLKDTHYFVPQALDLKAMQDGASRILGQHDFRSFRSTNSDKANTNCLVTRSEILQLGHGRLEFWIAADHFVYNMVRIIAGTLTEIGLGKRTPESIDAALSTSDRNLSGPTAPPWGLTLHSVRYPQNYKLFERDSFEEKA